MRADQTNFSRCQPRFAQRQPHRPGLSIHGRLRQMGPIRSDRGPKQVSIRSHGAGARMGGTFNHQHRPAMGRQKPITILIERAARAFRGCGEAGGRQRPHQREGMQIGRGEIGDRANHNRDIDKPGLDFPHRGTGGMDARRASTADGIKWPARTNQFGNRRCVMGIKPLQSALRFNPLRFLMKLQAGPVDIVAVDMLAANDDSNAFRRDVGCAGILPGGERHR